VLRHDREAWMMRWMVWMDFGVTAAETTEPRSFVKVGGLIGSRGAGSVGQRSRREVPWLVVGAGLGAWFATQRKGSRYL
jgi:hypothetical protein